MFQPISFLLAFQHRQSLGAAYRSVDDVFNSIHSSSSSFPSECQLRLDGNRGGHIESDLGHSGDGSGVQEERAKQQWFFFFFLFLSAHFFQSLALPPLLWERGVKAGLKEYGEQAEAGQNCERTRAFGRGG